MNRSRLSLPLAALLLPALCEPALTATFETDGGEWSVAANWNPVGVPGDNVNAWVDDVGAIVSDTVSTRARQTLGYQAGTSGSLTIQDGGHFTAARSFTIGWNSGTSGTLTVENGGRFELIIDGTAPQFFMGKEEDGSATLDIRGEMLLLGVGTNLNFQNDTRQQTIKLTDGYLQVPSIVGLAGTDTNIRFEMQRGLFIEKIDSNADRESLRSLAENGYIDCTSDNVHDSGWGKAQLGFNSYGELNHALTFGDNILYIDNGAGTWDGDNTVLAMWVEKAPVPTTYHVATSGSDSNDGLSADMPLRTLNAAADRVAPGDTVNIHAGSYEENLIRSNLSGLPDLPITFKAHGDGPVVIDGTKSVASIQASPWTLHENGIYKCTLTEDIWQLFVEGEMMMIGRWPNASIDDPDRFWDHDTWAHGDSFDSEGIMVTKPTGGADLAATGLDFRGARAVMNIGEWVTFVRFVRRHQAGVGSYSHLSYGDDEDLAFWDTQVGEGAQRYYLQCHLNCVDVEGEWHYDRFSKTLYFKTPGGGVPTGEIRGKVRTWGLNLTDSDHVAVDGIDFFGCSLRFKNCNDSRVEDCDFSYYSQGNWMLGGWEVGRCTLHGDRNIVRNCTFRYGDDACLDMTIGRDCLIENILAHDIDWTGTGNETFKFSFRDNRRMIIRRVTAYNCGGSECISVGHDSITELCRVGPRVGGLQDDGAAIQVRPERMPNSVVRNNWVFSHSKIGIRADINNQNPSSASANGRGLTVHNNVVWDNYAKRMPAIYIHGQMNNTHNNTSFRNQSPDISMSAQFDYENVGSFTYNNLTDPNGINGLKQFPPFRQPGGTLDRNWAANDAVSEMVAPDYLDYRPRAGSTVIDAGLEIPGITDGYLGAAPDAGAYEYGDNNYWIPGYQTEQASMPIPPSGVTNQPGDRDLIWLGGWEGVSYDIYFGTSQSAVAEADRSSPEFVRNQANNIFRPSAVSNTTCFWRIDTLTPEGTVEGEVWELRYGTIAPPAANNFTFMVDGGEWSDGASWDQGTVPGDNDNTWIDHVGAVISAPLATRARQSVGFAAGASGSLTIRSGAQFTAARSFTIGWNHGSSGTLTVENGGRFELIPDNTAPRFFMGKDANGAATLDIHGEMLLLGSNTALDFQNDTQAQTIKLGDGYLQVPEIAGLAETDTNIRFEMQKGLFIVTADREADRDALKSLADNGFIDCSSDNVHPAGWGLAQLGFGSYSELDYALLFGNKTLYLDTGAATWDGDSSVLSMWVEAPVSGLTSYATWAASNGASANPDEDSNGNGISNGIEFFMGGTPASPVTLAQPIQDGGVWTWTVPYDPLADTDWRFEASEDLEVWDRFQQGDPNVRVLSEPDRIEFTLPPGGEDRIFTRFVVSIP